MSQKKLRGKIILMMILCLWTAGLSAQTQPAHADEGETDTPSATPTIEPTLTSESTFTPVPTEIIDSPTQTSTETPTLVLQNTPSQTPKPTVTAVTLPGRYVADEVLVRFKNSATDEDINGCLEKVNGHVDSAIEELDVLVVKLNMVSVSNAVASLSACEGVRFVEPNYLAFSADITPTDSGWSNQYGLVNIRAPQGWEHTTGSSAITIAILDTGVELTHPDLAAKITAGYDFVNNDAIAEDDHGHGTHVAGIAAAASNNGAGIAGVSWGAYIMPVKVLNSAGGGTLGDIAAGITWATNHGAHIINLSIGSVSSSIVLQNAINYAAGHGVLIIAAVGNTSGNLIFYPAAYSNVIAVGATDSLNNRAPFSNYGSQIDLVAPGVSIYSTNNGSSYSFRDGTSMSAGFVSGFAALLLGIPGNSPSSVRSLMQSTALDLGSAGWDGFYGHGLIQMDTAIQMAWPKPTAIQANQSSSVFGNGFQTSPTYTPSPTISATVAIPSPFSTITSTQLVINDTDGNVDTPTPEIIVLETEEKNVEAGEWIMPCSALLLILAGLLLLWTTSRKKRFRS
jgi:subtilisin family serine protease